MVHRQECLLENAWFNEPFAKVLIVVLVFVATTACDVQMVAWYTLIVIAAISSHHWISFWQEGEGKCLNSSRIFTFFNEEFSNCSALRSDFYYLSSQYIEEPFKVIRSDMRFKNHFYVCCIALRRRNPFDGYQVVLLNDVFGLKNFGKLKILRKQVFMQSFSVRLFLDRWTISYINWNQFSFLSLWLQKTSLFILNNPSFTTLLRMAWLHLRFLLLLLLSV